MKTLLKLSLSILICSTLINTSEAQEIKNGNLEAKESIKRHSVLHRLLTLLLNEPKISDIISIKDF